MKKLMEILPKAKEVHSGHWIENLYCKVCLRKLTDDEIFDMGFNYALSEIDCTAILSLMKGIVPEEKEEFETCTGCGGIGSVPNHPHIEAHTCKRCNGSGIISRDDFKMWNACRKEMLRRIDEKDI